MAQRVQVILVCDLHDDDTAGEETVSFALDGAGYEMDLCTAHAQQVRDAFAPYVGAARRAGAGARGGGRGGSRTSAGSRRRGRRGSSEAAQIREWARGQGLAVPERGRIPADLAEKYAAANRR